MQPEHRSYRHTPHSIKTGAILCGVQVAVTDRFNIFGREPLYLGAPARIDAAARQNLATYCLFLVDDDGGVVVAAYDIESASMRKIPLWAFGFLYLIDFSRTIWKYRK
jgi:hypothetical protein